MYNIFATGYYSRGKFLDFELSCVNEKDENLPSHDVELQSHIKTVKKLLLAKVKASKPESAVFYVEYEGKFLERGELSKDVDFTIIKRPETYKEFIKLMKSLEREDKKSLESTKNMEENDI